MSSVVYSYWLQGIDSDWRPSTKESQALYTNLTPGHYRLHVRSRLAGTTWSEETVCNKSPTSPTPGSPTPDPSREGEGSIYSQHGNATEEVTTPLPHAGGVGGGASGGGASGGGGGASGGGAGGASVASSHLLASPQMSMSANTV